MSDPTLLADCRRFPVSVVALFETLPPRMRTAHLAKAARGLLARIDAVTPEPEAARYLSVCSGIEAATVAWHPLGWEAAAFSEIEAFPRAVLTHHYPNVPLHGDFTTIKGTEYGPVDLLVGGTPCQSFSVAGLRKGMDDPRGNLALGYLGLAARLNARWLVWENVPGVLSSNGGRDFGAFLGGLAELGYGFAYRVLDAQFFGVPQRRRRVFVVGYLGDWRRAAAVLFERHSLSGHPPPSREAGQAAPTLPSRSSAGGGLGTDFDCDGGLISYGLDLANLGAGGNVGYRDAREASICLDTSGNIGVAHTLRADGFDASEDGTGRGTPLVPVAIQERAVCENPDAGPDGAGYRTDGMAYTLEARSVPQAVAFQPLQPSVASTSLQATHKGGCDSADATEAGPGKVLRGVREEDEAESGEGRGDDPLQSPEVLRPEVHGEGLQGAVEGERPDGAGKIPCEHHHAEAAVPTVRRDAEPGGSPSGSGPAQQRSGEPDGALPELPHEGAPPAPDVLSRWVWSPEQEKWVLRYTRPAVETDGQSDGEHDASTEAMRGLRGASERAGPMRSSLHGGEAGGSPTLQVRRITVKEAERLQGFEDDYTLIPYRGKPAADGPRYKALGNSMAVPCMAWIGERIARVEALLAENEAAA